MHLYFNCLASNTLFFDQYLNWTGLLIEPTPCGKCLLPFNRPRAVATNGAICVNESLIDIGSMKAFCPPPQDSCTSWSPVRCTGAGIYAHEANLHRVDLFSIDVEEYYMNVLRSWDWSIKPVVIFIECSKADCWDFLKAQGYTIVEAGKLSIVGSQVDTLAWLNHATCIT